MRRQPRALMPIEKFDKLAERGSLHQWMIISLRGERRKQGRPKVGVELRQDVRRQGVPIKPLWAGATQKHQVEDPAGGAAGLWVFKRGQDRPKAESGCRLRKVVQEVSLFAVPPPPDIVIGHVFGDRDQPQVLDPPIHSCIVPIAALFASRAAIPYAAEPPSPALGARKLHAQDINQGLADKATSLHCAPSDAGKAGRSSKSLARPGSGTPGRRREHSPPHLRRAVAPDGSAYRRTSHHGPLRPVLLEGRAGHG